MLKKENRYDFKKELLQVHKKDRRDMNFLPCENEFAVDDGIVIVLPEDSDIVVLTAAKDFLDYLFTSMKVSARISNNEDKNFKNIVVSFNEDLGDASGYMGYRINVTDSGITLEGYDNRGIAQGFYFLEDLMNIRRAPFLEKKVTARKALFSPRFAQSPFGMFEFNDEALSYMAHLGYDAIELWINGYNVDKRGGFIDMPLLCERAEKYGIKIYVELYTEHTAHPDDPDSQSFYDEIYGTLFEKCPKLYGVMVEGECSNFHSRDPRVGKAPWYKNYEDNIPTGKVSPGFWPCNDYPQWITMIQNAVFKHKPDADVILCTYNWGWAPEEDRIALIEALPDNLSLMVTWEMCQKGKVGKTVQNIEDYTLAFAGPGDYFISEAKAAKKKGLRLYSIANTAGKTWDYGVIPYEPMPYQWIKRFENMVDAYSEYGLRGFTECIHYGFYPSFIGELEKWAFFTHEEDLRDVLKAFLVRDFGKENLEAVDKAMHLWSEAITHYTPTNEDQYGVFRVGPSFPFWLSNTSAYPENGKLPEDSISMHGNGIFNSEYLLDITGRNSFAPMRLVDEINEFEILAGLLKDGIDVLESIKEPNDELLKLIGIGKFMYYTTLSGINMKRFYVLRQKIHIADSVESLESLLQEVEKLLLAEKAIVKETISVVETDSRLGWEPSMEYMGDAKCLQWKLRQLDFELNTTIPKYLKTAYLNCDKGF